MVNLPKVVEEINKNKKSTKITTLSEAKAFKLKRFFSGSFGVDYITGGGYAYRRIQLLFGSKSSGKNALLNQSSAYTQRQCKLCHGILPYFVDKYNQPIDQWTFVLRNILGYGLCKCEKPIPKKVFILDYERALAIEEPRDVKISHITNKKTGEVIDELDYNDALTQFDALTSIPDAQPEEKTKIKELEQFFKSCAIQEQIIKQIATIDYLKKCGVLVDDLLVADPEDTEEGIELVTSMTKSKEVDMIIWDSLQAAIPRYVKDRDADQATMGVEAKQNGLLMRHVCSAFSATDLTDESEAYKPALFITSQVRSSLGGFISRPDSYSGGNAIQHHISLALEVKREKFLKEDGTEASFEDNFYGQRIRLRADKNKLSSPGDMYELDYFFREGNTYPIGIDSVGELINVGSKVGVIERAGAYYAIGENKFQGKKALLEFLRTNPTAVRDLYVQLMNRG